MSAIGPKVAIYVRVSTQDQSLDLQKSELLRFAKARGWRVHKVYEDKATGTNDNRPQLKALMRDARAREYDVLLIWKLDRLFRSIKGLVTSIQDFEALGIAFVSLKDQIDLSTPSGRLMVHMLGAFAEFEASLIRERVVAGLREAQRKGVQLGRPIRLDHSQIIRHRAEGLSMAQIARKARCSKAAVHKILKKSS
ncbi:MAG: recombinase family protein [Bdellovibrionales bacterium]